MPADVLRAIKADPKLRAEIVALLANEVKVASAPPKPEPQPEANTLEALFAAAPPAQEPTLEELFGAKQAEPEGWDRWFKA
jgi:hypothetical protein